MSALQWSLVLGYGTSLALLSLFALHRLSLAWAARRLLQEPPQPPPLPVDAKAWPRVLVQLPMYNEPAVAVRAIDHACRLSYPRDKLTIQVLDDSTDGSDAMARAAVARWAEDGVDVGFLHRSERVGFKAGALAAGLASSDHELVAIFDADFVPPTNFLRQLVGHFQDPNVGMVQARWEHLNATASPFTRGQAILLDGHFINEHGGRAASRCFFNFNGTAGIWRRACIDDAGGWSGATLTEDLDLSYRAQLRGWRFIYRPDVVVPAELPATVGAFKTQQHRWAKGAVETARICLRNVWAAPLSWRQKWEATAHLLGNATYPLVLFVALAMPWMVAIRQALPSTGLVLALDAGVLFGATGSLLVAYGMACTGAGRSRHVWLYFPVVLALGIGLTINNLRALLEGLGGWRTEFVRTPKAGERVLPLTRPKQHKLGPSWQAAIELFMAGYAFTAAAWAVEAGRLMAVPFAVLFGAGFLFLGGGGWPLQRQRGADQSVSSVDTARLREENLHPQQS